MATTTHPSKESVRNWANTRRAEKTPLPSPEEIRRQLGWDMVRQKNSQR